MSGRQARRTVIRGFAVMRPLVAAIALTSAIGVSSCEREQTFKVSTTADSGSRSLRAAISAANRASERAARGVRIEIPAGTYELSSCGSDDDNRAGDLDIRTNAPVTLVAVGSSVVIRQKCAGERVLDDRGHGVLTLIGVTLTGGTLVTSDASALAEGGGVRAVGDVILQNSKISGNSATGAPGIGATVAGEPTLGGDARGGGLFVGGSLQAADSTISSNIAKGGAGANAPSPDGFAASAGSAEGGGIYVVGSVTHARGSISDNQALGGIGGDGAHAASGGRARGGGIAQEPASSAAIELTGVILSNNLAIGGKSGVGGSAEAVRAGTGGSPGDGNATGGAIAASGAVKGRGISVERNKATGGTSVTCIGCSASVGRAGGITSGAGASFIDSTFSLNEATSGERIECSQRVPPWNPGCSPYFCSIFPSGGCPCNPSDIPPGSIGFGCDPATPLLAEGGAIWVEGDLELSGGTYSQNKTTLGQVIISHGKVAVRGGEYTDNAGGVIACTGDATVSGAKFQGNDSGGESTLLIDGRLTASDTQFWKNGGGVAASGADLTSVTLIENCSVIGAQGAAELSLSNSALGSRLVNTTLVTNARAIYAQKLELEHVTIVSHSTWPDVLGVTTLITNRSVVSAASGQTICGVAGTVQSSSYNWFSDRTCGLVGTGDRQSNAAFLLGPPANNGGTTQTSLPGVGSVLVDRVPSEACPVRTDARGVARPQGPACDIGAVEAEGRGDAGAVDAAPDPGEPDAGEPDAEGDFASGIAACPAPHAGASLDQSDLENYAGMSARTLPGYSVWQSFTAGKTGTLSQISMGFFNAMSGTGTLEIRDGAGSSGAILQTLVVDARVDGMRAAFVNWTVSVPVASGHIYTFQFTPGGTVPDPYGVALGRDTSYLGGSFGLDDPSGSYTGQYDAVFCTYVTP